MALRDAVPLELDGPDGDLEPFTRLDDLAVRARIAFVVEMDHFVREKADFRLMCLRYLASRGWRWFGEELDWRVGRRIDQYLQDGDETLLDPIDEPAWYTSGVLAEAMQRHPTNALNAAQRAFARSVRSAVPEARWFGFDVGRSDSEYLELANAATTVDELRPAMAVRERLMQQRVAAVLRDRPRAKVALMAGSLHLMKDDDRVRADVGAGPGGDTVSSLGHFLSQEIGKAPVVSIWMLHGRGNSANPWLEPPGRLKPGRGTLNQTLARRWDTACFLPVGDDRRRRRITHMHNLSMTCRLAEQTDAVVFAPHVTPIEDEPSPGSSGRADR